MSSPIFSKTIQTQKRATENEYRFHFIDGAFFEVIGDVEEDYLVQFFDASNNELIYREQIKNNQWVRTARQFFTVWQVKVFKLSDQQLWFSHQYDCHHQRVYVSLESKALGDTLAWFQCLEDFQRKHNCTLICSTFMNGLFQQQYPQIQFVEPGETVQDLYAMYRVGWFYLPSGDIDLNKNVKDFRKQTLGESAADILGIPYTYNKPRLKAASVERPVQERYVCIAVHSTAQAKYWNNPTGWNEVVAYLRQRGYKVVLLSREGMHYMGNNAPADVSLLPQGDIGVVVDYLSHASMFVGIGSGLSWLSWAVGCKTCVISGFSYPYTEATEMIKVSAKPGNCAGCFNRYTLDVNDWQWCPDHKNSSRMFECTRNISGQDVIEVLSGLLD